MKLATPARKAALLLRQTSGHFAIMTAITAPVLITLAAFAVDAGALYVEKRRAQALVDLAAITAAANIDRADAAALTVIADNGVDGALLVKTRPDGTPDFTTTDATDQVAVVVGSYKGDPDIAASDRFLPGNARRNAVRVTYRTTGPRYFAGALIPAPRIVAAATASSDVEAAFSIGSRLAALDGGILNGLLGGLLGSGISLSIMDYNALLTADIHLLDFLDALAIDLDLKAATYQDVLDTQLSIGQIAGTLSRLGVAKTATRKLAVQSGGANTPKLRLSSLIDLGWVGGQVLDANIRQLTAEIGVLELLTASAVAAGKGKQVAVDLGATVPGLLKTTVTLAIGEPPQHAKWFRLGDEGGFVRTAQTRLSVITEIAGLGGLLGTSIRLPLYLELAFAEARLSSVTCPTGRPDSVKVSVDARPGAANLFLAEVDPAKLGNFASPVPRRPARLVQMPLVSITAQANAEIVQMSYKTIVFSASDIANGRIRQVSTDQLTTSLTRSLFSSLQLDIDVIGLGLGLPSGLTGLLGQTIGAATPAIDGLLANLLSTLGLAIGQADIRVHGASCGRAVLVQ